MSDPLNQAGLNTPTSRRAWRRTLLIIFLSAGVVFFGKNYLARLLVQSISLRPVEIIFCDVGQGDATIIKIPRRRVIIIDGGPDGSLLRCLGKNLPFWQRQIDFLILSHYHDDHILGFPEVARRYSVKNFIYAPDTYNSAPRLALINYLSRRTSQVRELGSSGSLELSRDCYLKLFNPAVLAVPPDGNNSLITKLSCRGHTFLLAGDNEMKVEQALIASEFDFSADVFKASHHGSKTSNTADFLIAGGFQSLVISVGENKFGHPSPEVLNRAEELGLTIQRTDQDGTIKFIVP